MIVSSVCFSSSGDCSRESVSVLSLAFTSLTFRRISLRSSSLSFCFRFFGLSWRPSPSLSAILAPVSRGRALRRRRELFVELLRRPARLAHRLDLLLHLAAPLLDPLVGDLF